MDKSAKEPKQEETCRGFATSRRRRARKPEDGAGAWTRSATGDYKQSTGVGTLRSGVAVCSSSKLCTWERRNLFIRRQHATMGGLVSKESQQGTIGRRKMRESIDCTCNEVQYGVTGPPIGAAVHPSGVAMCHSRKLWTGKKRDLLGWRGHAAMGGWLPEESREGTIGRRKIRRSADDTRGEVRCGVAGSNKRKVCPRKRRNFFCGFWYATMGGWLHEQS